jgi:zinc protease
MMFQESENVGQDQFFKLIQGAGGSLNGSTSQDRTNYYEVVPKNALELVLWMESDRMGYLTNTVTKRLWQFSRMLCRMKRERVLIMLPTGIIQLL